MWQGELTLLNEVSGLGLTSNEMTTKDSRPLSRIVNVADILFKISRNLSVPDCSRDGD
jgi:hypothetical protein